MGVFLKKNVMEVRASLDQESKKALDQTLLSLVASPTPKNAVNISKSNTYNSYMIRINHLMIGYEVLSDLDVIVWVIRSGSDETDVLQHMLERIMSSKRS